jgi:small conductance mechanosensitive channel
MNELTKISEIVTEQQLVVAGIRVLLVIVIAVVALRVTSWIANKIDRKVIESGELKPSEGIKRRRTLTNIVKYSINTLVLVLTAITILHETGVDITPILAGAGIMGIVIGLGTQNLMRDALGGMFVLMEHQYDVDDVISAAGVTGKVEKVTLRMTRLRDVDGNVHFVPNGQASVVTNLTKEWARAKLDVEVAYKEDVDRVIAVLKEVGQEMGTDPDWQSFLLDPAEVPGVQLLGDSGVQIRIFFKTQPDQKWNVTRELRRRIKNRFDEEGIEIPFPHRTVYFGTGETGTVRVASSEPDVTHPPDRV